MMQQICSLTGTPFDVKADDLVFYDKISPVFGGKKYEIPLPKLCPEERYRRRLAFRNERNLYHRRCDLSGRSMISMYPADTPFPVYHITEWLSDKWDPKSYGRDFDFSRTYAEQFQEMCNEIPHFNAFVDPHTDINSEYTNCSYEAKNCYLITQAEKNEDCYYSRGINQCKSCCDCCRVHRCELCYECIDANNCYHCYYVQDCDNCNDCYFSSDLRGCKHCFGCHGLVQKEYHIFNEPVTKEEWGEKVGSLKLTHEVIAQMQKQSAEQRMKVPQRATRQIQCENVLGDHVTNCRDCHNVFDANDLEACSYCNEIANGARYCYDYCMWGINCELLYDCSGCGNNVYHCIFCNHCWQNASSLLYSESCFPAVKDCFGCFGLHSSQYCILNKQYTKEEYEELVPKIIEHMQKTGEWGEFFPVSLSPFGYNETMAQEYFPMTKENVLQRGWQWYEDNVKNESYREPSYEIPNAIDDVNGDITKQILRCEVTKKPYKIISQELAFYRQMNLPIPRECPDHRHRERMALRNPRVLHDRTCDNCSVSIQTTYAPDRPEKVFCEKCYLDSLR